MGHTAFLAWWAHRYLLYIAFLGEWPFSGNDENTKKLSWHGSSTIQRFPDRMILDEMFPDKMGTLIWGTFCPWEHFVREHFVQERLVWEHFVLGTFCAAIYPKHS